MARKVLQRLRDRATAAGASLAGPSGDNDPLTARELDILRLLSTGATNREIAEALTLSEGTVKNYVSAILATIGLHDRTQAALFAVRHGLVQ